MCLIKSSYSVYQTKYHIVWVTRFRKEWINDGVKEFLIIKLKEVLNYYPDFEYMMIGIDKDHLHLHMVIPPKYAVGKVVDILKANTSRGMKQKFDFLKNIYWKGTGIWSVGYFVSTVGVNEEVIRRYIEMQGKEDSGQAKLELKSEPRP